MTKNEPASNADQLWSADLPSTIAGETTYEMVIKKSRFITHLKHVTDVDQADAFIAEIKTQYWEARHNCVALSLGVNAQQQRSSDDGEPSGTAGIPMLEVLRHRNLTDLVVVVTRYFGGILLGAGGLVRAYSGAVSEGLDTATMVDRAAMDRLKVATDHASGGRVEYFLRDWVSHNRGLFEDPEYDQGVIFSVLVRPAQQAQFLADLASFSSGAATATYDSTTVVDIPR